MNNQQAHGADPESAKGEVLDALVVGGGVSGIYALYRLNEQGHSVRLVERGSGLGGTWFWNRYPGARFDSDSYSYGYFFSEILAEEWQWSEHYAGQPEIERYFNFVVDRFELRDKVQLDTTVVSARFDSNNNVWVVGYADGQEVVTRFLVLATGMLSEPYIPAFDGMDDFQGVMVHSGEWPAEGIDFAGKRVAIFGTGSSGVQLVPEVARDAASLTVFQRSGHWVTPLNNRPFTPEEQEGYRKNFREVHQKRLGHIGGFIHEPEPRLTFEVSEEERLKKYDEVYHSGGLRILSSNFADTLADPAANQEFSKYVAEKISASIEDPDLAERLIPNDHGFGMHRPPKGTSYYETYNSDHVQLASLKESPVVRFTKTGVVTTEDEFEFDVIIFATGFEAWLGALKKLDIRGKDGQALMDAWSDGPRTLLGMGVPGFPNMTFVAGVHSVGGNLPAFSEVHADWASDLITYVKRHGYSRVEVTEEAAREWTEHVYETVKPVLLAKGSWYQRGNIPGSDGKILTYYGGLGKWREWAAQVADSGYKGMELQ
ncbi:NAD(P)/FAD-dependent oxidoreductase (plasmid) [Rhodococcus sp. USK10]|uniref:flavin-containing monooxygenase n=1 Tax=Rhodococcus sp. USK10 TaxID=2789739 RepID=UPI001C5F8FA3|nr:NAD(P)/FAD-dependent oxidoreductase [Rhodococcus sp. USK10]QYB00374.1 NAD(P)/FAD-dependent oxidoreductase [Rhodococcus sp. USK10]